MEVKHIKAIIIIALVAFIYSCARVPMTGRRQTKLLPESELVSMSLTAYSGFLDTSTVVSSGSYQNMVKSVGARISTAVEAYLMTTRDSVDVKNYDWEFNLVDDPTVNAWCMPGGKVVFYTGIMPICQNEAGVAVVMGHEIAHAVARHGNERMSQGLIQQLGGVALAVAISDKPAETQQLYNLAYGVVTTVGVMLPFSRKHESEADHIGLMFMAMAGYNPEEAPKFWERMSAQSSGARPPEFLSTHPNPDRRAENLKKLMPQAQKYYTDYLNKQKTSN
ncbi:MAG: M48 family metallopeptidase [Bacteroidetes bacterium]|nr:M48 family metallopeptidase [Bacteroidota bacterium]